ncbi:hypothetical protein ACFV2X_28330 [Streptomyces sp. NPDC059679]|uniref:hypothetical protein n=1 Tax=Streptomyces sp. NPDC059679 TaxID=3346903 RepID=UPI00369FDBDB
MEEVSELLAVWESGACADVKADLRPRIAARITDAEARTAELARFTATLHRALERLDELPDRFGRCDPACTFLAAPPGLSAGRVDAAPLPTDRAEADPGVERWRTAPVACSLDSGRLGERRAQWRRLVDGAEQQEIPGGSEADAARRARRGRDGIGRVRAGVLPVLRLPYPA